MQLHWILKMILRITKKQENTFMGRHKVVCVLHLWSKVLSIKHSEFHYISMIHAEIRTIIHSRYFTLVLRIHFSCVHSFITVVEISSADISSRMYYLMTKAFSYFCVFPRFKSRYTARENSKIKDTVLQLYVICWHWIVFKSIRNEGVKWSTIQTTAEKSSYGLINVPIKWTQIQEDMLTP